MAAFSQAAVMSFELVIFMVFVRFEDVVQLGLEYRSDDESYGPSYIYTIYYS